MNELGRFLPGSLRRRLGEAGLPPDLGRTSLGTGVVLFADVVGFTRLTQQLERQGADGADEVTRRLNACFAPIVRQIHAHGGEIVRFAGDAVIGLWSGGASWDGAAQAATAAALAMREEIHSQAAGGDGLGLRVGLGAGGTMELELGGHEGRWEMLLAGEAMSAASRSERLANPGEVVVSSAILEALRGQISTRSVDDHQVVLAVGPGSWAPATTAPRLTEDLITPWLPPIVPARLRAGYGGWLSELRPVSTLFLQLRGIALDTMEGRLALHSFVGRTQGRLATLEGQLHKILADDRGVTLMMVLGLPPLAHEDDEARAVRAARALVAEAGPLGAFGVGVATGRAFCGVYGTEERAEYSVVGDSVNLAARLMAAARGELLVDRATVRGAARRFDFCELPPISLRGRAAPEPVFRPIAELDLTERQQVLRTGRHDVLRTRSKEGALSGVMDPVRSSEFEPIPDGSLELPSIRLDQAPDGPREVVGRDAEIALLSGRLQDLQAGRTVAPVLIEAEAGLGKSTLAGALSEMAIDVGVPVLLGAGDSISRDDAWFAWREVFTALFAADPQGRPPAAQVADLVRDKERLGTWVPLLSAVVNTAVEDNEWTRQMTGAVRADATRELLAEILVRSWLSRPAVLLLDDVQWMDASSWSLLLALCRRTPRAMIVVLTRPMGAVAPPEWTAIRDGIGATTIHLREMARHELLALVARRLGVGEVPPRVGDVIERKAGGNPFLAEEIAFALRDGGQIRVEGRSLVIHQAALALPESGPDTLTTLVTARLDRLAERVQLAAKVAAVLGREFSLTLLRSVHPAAGDLDGLEQTCAELVQQQVLVSERTDGGAHWAFRHAVFQQCAYGLLPTAQRRDLHARAARTLEDNPRRTDKLAVLAWHWGQAQDLDRCVGYLVEAGHEAVRGGAGREALHFFEAAFVREAERVAGGAVGRPARELAGWHSALGEVWEVLGDMRRSQAAFGESLANLGYSLPRSSLAWTVRMLLETVLQVARRWLPAALFRKPSPERREMLRLATKDAAMYGAVCYFTNEPLPWLTASLMAVNLADLSGDPSPAAAAYGSLGNIVGTLRMGGLARQWFDLSQTAEIPRDRTVGNWAEAVTHLSFCRWPEAEDVLRRGIELGQATGDGYTLGVGETIRGIMEALRGPPRTAIQTFEEVYDGALRRENIEHQSWGLTFRAPLLLATGELDAARALLTQAESKLDQFDPFTRLVFWGVRASVHARVGELAQGLAAAERCHALWKAQPMPMYTYLSAFSGASEAALAAAGAARKKGDAKEALRCIRLAADLGRDLKSGAFAFQFFGPRVRAINAACAAAQGKVGRASRLGRRAVDEARRLGLRFEEAQILRLLAEALPPEAPDRSLHLTAARALLTEFGCLGDLARLPDEGKF